MVGIIDYNAGNITSVERSLKKLGIEYVMSKKPEELEKCSHLIFPGDGDDAYAMKELDNLGFTDFIKRKVSEGVLLLGICVGSQIIFSYSDEGNINCLNIIEGNIKHLSNLVPDIQKKGLKVPHMGWNNLEFMNGDCPLFNGINPDCDFYFVHSYVICPKDSSVIKAVADYGTKIPSVIQKDNVFACQFHPEKSGEPGLKILENFCRL
ncbi:MAG: imidazole glycerol phosphate synthase subunit HisH [Treponema sp.]|nr:imidazole glycerol phosphate synthase subunit HisH [Treponema sp.]